MTESAARSTSQRLRPILLGLIVAVPGFLLVYSLVLLVIFAVAQH